MLLVAKIKLSETLKLHSSFQPDAGELFGRDRVVPLRGNTSRWSGALHYGSTSALTVRTARRGGPSGCCLPTTRSRRTDGTSGSP